MRPRSIAVGVPAIFVTENIPQGLCTGKLKASDCVQYSTFFVQPAKLSMQAQASTLAVIPPERPDSVSSRANGAANVFFMGPQRAIWALWGGVRGW